MRIGIADIAQRFWREREPVCSCFGAGVQDVQAKVGRRMDEIVRIGLDVVPMSYPPSGVRAYVLALIEAFRSRDGGVDLVPLAPLRGSIRGANRFLRLDWDLRGIAGSANAAGVDLLHMTRFAAPGVAGRPFVVTVHDLIPLQLPEYQASIPARIQSELARRMVLRARRIIVPSRYVADDVTRMFGIPAERIDVIPMGVTMPNPSETAPLFSGPYVLHSGGFDARKNLPALIRAFGLAAPQMGPDWRLVLLGAPHSGNPVVFPSVQDDIERSGLRDRIVLTGRVSESDKHALYQHAAIAVAPSLSEGFGLPILEAMSYGIPVVASNRTSHPEVAGEAAVVVEPTAEALAEELVRVANDTALRDDLRVRGVQRAAQFPWSRTAELTAQTYRTALA